MIQYIQLKISQLSYYLIIFAIAAFLCGHYGNNNSIYGNLFITIIIFQQLIELGFFKITDYKVETLGFELIIIILFYILGTYYIRSKGAV